MPCAQYKKLIPLYMDHQLEAEKRQGLDKHLSACLSCQKEVRAYQQMWELLGDDQEISPQPGFVSRFWTKLALEESTEKSLWDKIKEAIGSRRLAYRVATVCMIFIMVGIYLPHYYQQKVTLNTLSSMNESELEMVEDVDFAQHLDVLEDLELYEDFDIIQRIQG